MVATKTPKLEVIATWDACSNEINKNLSWVDNEKLPSIYRALRKQVFVGEPIQENQGNNELVFRNMGGPYGNYGWQLFRTAEGTAMLEYMGPVSYWPHERLPLSVQEEHSLRHLIINFHQQERAIEIARDIVKKYTKKRER